jgi:hypothetical protein
MSDDTNDLLEQLRTRHVKLGFNEVTESLFSAAADEIERLRAALLATLVATAQLCNALDVDMNETYFRVKNEKSGEVLARQSLADILQDARAALGEEKKG